VFGKRSYPFEFEFKMNHIKQIVKVELIGKFTAIKFAAPSNSAQNEIEIRSICKSGINYSCRCRIFQFWEMRIEKRYFMRASLNIIILT